MWNEYVKLKDVLLPTSRSEEEEENFCFFITNVKAYFGVKMA
jgi:hypothetical protein